MDLKRPRRLNLNAPLLSTRRLGYYSGVADTSCSSDPLSTTAQNTSERVPFSWEQAPGKPKDMERSDHSTRDGSTPWPRLPPCLMHHPPKEANEEADDDADNNSYDVALHDQEDHHHGCGGDGDDDDDDDNNDDVFSDAMDVFSLSEALDIVQKQSEKAQSHSDNNEGLRLKLEESNGYQSPTYMINRFLPDATALAASSALHFHSNFDSNKFCETCSYKECYLSGSARHSSSYASSPKGCGLELLFPWRVKHKLCSMKSPVLPCSTNLQKHNKRSSKQKKHMSWSCTNVKGDI